MIFPTQVGIRGRQNVQVLKNDKVIRESGFHKNLILDNFFNDLTSPSATNTWGTSISNQHVVVGTGSTAPANSQTNLATYLAGKSTADSTETTYLGITAGKAQYRYRRTWTFAESAVIGNVSEVGTKAAGSPGSLNTMALHTRALVLDVSNNPTSIPVGTGEQLRVIHEFIFEVSLTRFSQNMSVTTGGNTTNHLVEMEWANVTAGATFVNLFMDNTVLRGGAGTSVLTPRSAFASLTFNASYGSPTVGASASIGHSKVLTQISGVMGGRLTCTLASTDGNVAGGMGGMAVGAGGSSAPLYLKFTPALPKTNLNKLVIGLDFTYARAA